MLKVFLALLILILCAIGSGIGWLLATNEDRPEKFEPIPADEYWEEDPLQ